MSHPRIPERGGRFPSRCLLTWQGDGGSFDIDLFASRLNYKVPCYVSWRPDPDAKLIDAFYMDWGPYLFYAFPPISMIMIATCLQKITQDKATGVLIVPIWTTTPWFTGILNLLMDKSLILPQSNSLLTQPLNGDLHPLRHQLCLMACKVSGKAPKKIISNDFTAIILQSWSAGTQKQYQPYIAKWHRFCAEREINPYNPPLNIVLDFLVHRHNQDLEYTTINTARNAISAIILPQGTTTIGSHPIISRFMKGIYRSKPPRPKYQITWDVQPVLTYLSSLGTANNLDLKTLSLKLLMLVALVSAQSGQSLHICLI